MEYVFWILSYHQLILTGDMAQTIVASFVVLLRKRCAIIDEYEKLSLLRNTIASHTF